MLIAVKIVGMDSLEKRFSDRCAFSQNAPPGLVGIGAYEKRAVNVRKKGGGSKGNKRPWAITVITL